MSRFADFDFARMRPHTSASDLPLHLQGGGSPPTTRAVKAKASAPVAAVPVAPKALAPVTSAGEGEKANARQWAANRHQAVTSSPLYAGQKTFADKLLASDMEAGEILKTMAVAAEPGRVAAAAPRPAALDWDKVNAKLEARESDPWGGDDGDDRHGWGAIHAAVEARKD